MISFGSRTFALPQRFDRGVLLGTMVSFVLISIGIIIGGQAANFFDLSSAAIVVGGTIGATLVNFSFQDLELSWEAVRNAVSSDRSDPRGRLRYLVEVATRARNDGILVLEQEAQYCRDPFLRKAFEVTVDGQSESEIRRILNTEIQTSAERGARAVQVFEAMGGYAPAMGLIGTVIGLIKMLGALQDPSTVGPAMSLALVTTLYGAVLANVVLLPLAGKLKNRGEEQLLERCLTLEGVVAVSKSENAIVVEQRLRSFLG